VLLEQVLLAIGFGWMAGSAVFFLGLFVRFVRLVDRKSWFYRAVFVILIPSFAFGLVSIGNTLLYYNGMRTSVAYATAVIAGVVVLGVCTKAVQSARR